MTGRRSTQSVAQREEHSSASAPRHAKAALCPQRLSATSLHGKQHFGARAPRRSGIRSTAFTRSPRQERARRTSSGTPRSSQNSVLTYPSDMPLPVTNAGTRTMSSAGCRISRRRRAARRRPSDLRRSQPFWTSTEGDLLPRNATPVAAVDLCDSLTRKAHSRCRAAWPLRSMERGSPGAHFLPCMPAWVNAVCRLWQVRWTTRSRTTRTRGQGWTA